MKIIIVGCGKIGTTIVANLTAEGHDVVAVDRSQTTIEEISNIYDVMCVCGNGADSDTLQEAGADKCDLFVAVTASDETNMLACFLARRMGAGHTIARIRTPEYNDKSLGYICQNLDISAALNPDLLAAHELYNILKLPSAVRIETFSSRNVEMVELILKPDSPLDGVSLIDLRRQYAKVKFLICAVQRSDEVIIPSGSFVLRAGDKIALTAAPTEIQKLLRQLGLLQKSARSVMILGASRIAYYLAKRLLTGGTSVKIIEKNIDRCNEFCNALPDVMMIHGDGAKQEVLLEEGLESVDAFVALTGSDEENILISIYAAQQKVPKVISKVNRAELASLAERIGLDCIVMPRNIISGVLSRYARALQNSEGSNVESLYKIMDNRAEALEFHVTADFPYSGIPLKELGTRPGILIAAIIRGRKTIIPSGDDSIAPGDKVIVLAANCTLGDLADIVAQD
ncbi:MAG: Trk system potassium transporter TrkA [Clostridia bacterium]|nr:Trk system potassium transporter TrkA [Clostridia bacterium]